MTLAAGPKKVIDTESKYRFKMTLAAGPKKVIDTELV